MEAHDELKTKRLERYAASDRAFLLDALFPDVGGASLFNVKERQDLASVFAGRQCDAPALEVLELFDRIGRFVGADAATVKPFAQFSQTVDGGGAYYDVPPRILIAREKADAVCDFFTTFAHEVGHWFELRVLGYDVASDNVNWLRDVTGDENAFDIREPRGEILNLNSCQIAFWEYNYYSAKVYPLRRSPDATPYRACEAASTGFAGLLTDPEAFARSAPDHFDRLLSIIQAAKIDRK